MNDVNQEPSRGKLWLAAVIGVAGFLLFAGMLYLFYFPVRAEHDTTPALPAADLAELEELDPAAREARLRELRWQRRIPTAEDRYARLQEVRDQAQAALTNYSWIDREQGIVRLPIERAMELTVQEIGKGRAR